MSMVILLIVMVAMVWFMQRSQKKQAQARQEQLNAIQKGDEVVTIGGLFALVDDVDPEAGRVVLDVDGIYLPFELAAIKRVVTKTGQEIETSTPMETTAVETEEATASAIESD